MRSSRSHLQALPATREIRLLLVSIAWILGVAPSPALAGQCRLTDGAVAGGSDDQVQRRWVPGSKGVGHVWALVDTSWSVLHGSQDNVDDIEALLDPVWDAGAVRLVPFPWERRGEVPVIPESDDLITSPWSRAQVVDVLRGRPGPRFTPLSGTLAAVKGRLGSGDRLVLITDGYDWLPEDPGVGGGDDPLRPSLGDELRNIASARDLDAVVVVVTDVEGTDSQRALDGMRSRLGIPKDEPGGTSGVRLVLLDDVANEASAFWQELMPRDEPGRWEETVVPGTPGEGRPWSLDTSALDDVGAESVALVGDGERWNCTAFVVDGRVLLTARHCLPAREATFAATGGHAYATIRIVAEVAHPDPSVDIALLILDRHTGRPPLELRGAEESMEPRGTLTGIGYGATDSLARSGFGQRHLIQLQVNGWGCDGGREGRWGCSRGLEFVVPASPGTDTCAGDSGAPVLEPYVAADVVSIHEAIQANDRQALSTAPRSFDCGWRVVGVTARSVLNSRAACGDGGVYVRMDAVRTWIDQTLDTWRYR